MSYQSLKHILGETSLERKCRFLFGACLLVLITASFWFYGEKTKELVYGQNDIICGLLVEEIMLTIHWNSLETKGESQELVKEMTKRFSKEEYTWKFILPGAVDGPNTPDDDFEWDVRDEFNKAALDRDKDSDEIKHRFQFVSGSDGDQYYEYYQPVYASAQSCIECHRMLAPQNTGLWPAASGMPGSAPRQVGDLMAIIKVSIPNKKTQEAIDGNRGILLTTAIVTVFLAMIAAYVIVRYVIVKPLRHLRDVSDAVRRGDMSQRAEIHTGDEFEFLAVSFNRMVRHLVATQEELRHVNIDLDGKVDELAQVNMRLYELNAIKSEFLATMSHELRTPLNSILGFSEVLGAIDSLDEKQKRYVANIQSSGRMLLEMINDILDLAKIESGNMGTRLTEFPVEQAVLAQCDMARPLVERKNIDLEADIPDDLPPMVQDQARMQQILNNLLSNAIKFTPEGGRITVAAQRDAETGNLVLQVSDTGVGIAEEDQVTIFEKFRQGRTVAPSGDSMAREYSGTGLGLSIVQELCKLLGGEVSVQSELGRGSTFTVRLPWTLTDQPRLDSSMIEGFEEFTKPRLEFRRDHKQTDAEQPEPQVAE